MTLGGRVSLSDQGLRQREQEKNVKNAGLKPTTLRLIGIHADHSAMSPR